MDPNPGGRNEADPNGSRSETLVFCITTFFIYFFIFLTRHFASLVTIYYTDINNILNTKIIFCNKIIYKHCIILERYQETDLMHELTLYRKMKAKTAETYRVRHRVPGENKILRT